MNLSLIVRRDNGGLGIQSRDFARHVPHVKTLAIGKGAADIRGNVRCADAFTREDFEWLVEGVDCVVSFETWYDWSFVPFARDRGVKTVLLVNPEFLHTGNDL